MTNAPGVLAALRNVPWAPVPNTVTLHPADRVPEPWTTAIALVTRPAPAGLEVLLVDVRSRGLDAPGGRREPGEDLPATVRRELAEETGLALAGATPLTVLGYQHLHVLAPAPAGYPYPHPDSYQAITTVTVPAGTEPGGTTIPAEIGGHCWLPLADTRDACAGRSWLPFLERLQTTARTRA